jgi:protein involved in polysaccharide export with SLBB domain
MRKPIAMASRRRFPRLTSFIALLCSALAISCAAMSNPGVEGIPVHLLPPELRGRSVAGMRTIPLSLLGQERPEAYRIDAGDVLGVWIEGILGEKGQQPPIQTSIRLENVDLPPATGFPIQVQRDGTISLPSIESLKVAGMTFKEAEDAIRRAYVDRQILRAGRERIIVSLMRPRTYHVLVLRQDSSNPVQTVVTSQLGGGGPEYIGVSRKGTGWDLVLPAYQNDVLTALAKTGGLPGTDAIDTVIIERNTRSGRNWDLITQEFQAHGSPAPAPGSPIVQIPLRTQPGTPLAFRPEDVILHDGDVVFIPARDERLFYTGGLLPPGQHILPRDSDLDVLEAVARVRGPMFNGAFSTSNLAGTVLLPGLGQPTPSLLTVVRRLPDGCGQISIRIDMNRAVKDARERLLVQPGDFLILQETPAQGMVRYLTQVVDVPFYYLFQVGPRLFTGTAFSAPGGTAPVTITPMSMSTNVSTGYSGNPTSSTTTTPLFIPTPTTGR